MWNDVKYTPGTLKVVTYNAQGKAVAEEEVRTAGPPHHIKLEANQTKLRADGEDLAFVTASVVDAQGTLCPNATPSLRMQVSGTGRFRAVSNGDPTDLEVFHQPQMHAFSGQLVVIVQASTTAGDVQLKVSGKGLHSALLRLQAEKATVQ